eukprot:Polyplicarium_translucidae@DN3184_c0_g2_i1.p1
MLTRFEFLAALYDEEVHPLPAGVRDAWKSLYESNPLAAFLVGRTQFPCMQKVFLQGLLSMPEELVSHILHFVGRREAYAKTFNLCRAAAALSYRIRFEYMELRATALWLHEDHPPDAKELYKLFWKIEKMITVQGHYWLRWRTGGKGYRGARFSPPFEGARLDWRIALAKARSAPRVPLLHVRSLTVPASSEMWRTVNAVRTCPSVPAPFPSTAVSHGLSLLDCPNLVEFYAPNVDGDCIAPVEEFFSRHRTLRIFAGPVQSDELKASMGGYGGSFPCLDHRVLKNWQFVEFREVADCSFKWPRFAKKIPSNAASTRGIGFSCTMADGVVRIVSQPPSLNMRDVAANIRAITISHRPACVVLEKIGELAIRLFSLEVGACLQEPWRCPLREVVEAGLRRTESVAVRVTEGEDLCDTLKSLLVAFRCRSVCWPGVAIHEYTRRRGMTDNPDRMLCAALVERIAWHHDGEVRFRAWSRLPLDCDHHKALARIADAKKKTDLLWYAARCRCDISWNARDSHGRHTTVRSSSENASPQRQVFEQLFERAEGTEEGRWEEARNWIRNCFDGDGPNEEEAEW